MAPFLIIGFFMFLLVLLFLRDFHEAGKYVDRLKNSSCEDVVAKYKYMEVLKNTENQAHYLVIDMCYNEIFQIYKYLLINLDLAHDSIKTNHERNNFKRKVLSQELPEYTGSFLDNRCSKVTYGYVNNDYLLTLYENKIDENFIRIMK